MADVPASRRISAIISANTLLRLEHIMAFPSFYRPEKTGMLFMPNTMAAVEAGRSAALPPAALDTEKTALLLVDMQVDFVHPDGALYVPGAVEDSRRTIEWIFNNVGRITTIIA